MQVQTGDRVMVTDGSSDGHIGKVVAVRSNDSIRIIREADGIEVDIPLGKYYVMEDDRGRKVNA